VLRGWMEGGGGWGGGRIKKKRVGRNEVIVDGIEKCRIM